MTQEEKIKEFLYKIDSDPSGTWEGQIREAIQFGSQLTIDRAKEKVEKLKTSEVYIYNHYESKVIEVEEVLQAIKESQVI
jgi:hypothetical protein